MTSNLHAWSDAGDCIEVRASKFRGKMIDCRIVKENVGEEKTKTHGERIAEQYYPISGCDAAREKLTALIDAACAEAVSEEHQRYEADVKAAFEFGKLENPKKTDTFRRDLAASLFKSGMTADHAWKQADEFIAAGKAKES